MQRFFEQIELFGQHIRALLETGSVAGAGDLLGLAEGEMDPPEGQHKPSADFGGYGLSVLRADKFYILLQRFFELVELLSKHVPGLLQAMSVAGAGDLQRQAVSEMNPPEGQHKL